ncbi:hypothetical protein [Anaerotruncus rubiinfantis]|uniref:hypothetical protein n=1 Tax=Anaerotruncus rubiinfantis TaxID=1720200 RepID=UPI00083536D5|nr:hypothetical protein [Anaerotruncus rubiinfantis]
MKKMTCFVPGVLALLFYCVIGFFGSFRAINPFAWGCVALLFLSGGLLTQKQWWGCFPGIFVGAVLIYMSTQYTGQIINIEGPSGIILCVFYLVYGIRIYRRKDR